MFHRKNPTFNYGGTSQCLECKGDLPRYSRPDKLFCSDTCRKRHSWRPQQADQALDKILSDLASIRRYLKTANNHEHIDKVNTRLKFIRGEVYDILRLRDQETIREAGERADLIAGMRK